LLSSEERRKILSFLGLKKSKKMSEAPAARLNLTTLDPRQLFPTQENIVIVTNCVQNVQQQLEQDRVRLRQYPDNQQARESRNETLSYLALLNDWINQARNIVQQPQQQQRPNRQPALAGARQSTAHGVIMENAKEGQYPVLVSIQVPSEVRECLWDLARNLYYVKIRKIRDTIYGSVKLYQIGRMDTEMIRFSLPAEQVAVKIYDKESVRKRRSRDGHAVQEDPLKELAIQQRLSNPGHRYVMPLLACLESPTKLFAVYPFVGGGELFEFVSNHAPLPEPTAKALMRGMLDAVHYCHAAGICHRDISLENFLLGGEGSHEPLLIDFGLSVIMEPDGDNWAPIPHTGAVGKQFYMAPEVYNSNGIPYDGRKLDIWSLGVCLAIMLTGVPLWECPSTADDRFRASIIRKELPRVLRLWGFELSAQVLALLQRMLELNPTERASIPEIAQMEWIR